MKPSDSTYRTAAALAACAIVLCWSTSTGHSRRTYEIDAQIYSVPGSQSDAARAINAYERLMERHMDLTERNLIGLAMDIRAFMMKLDAVEAGLERLDQRLARIERHLGVAVAPPVSIPHDPNAPPGPKVLVSRPTPAQ
jgi:hypothetical protein